VDVGFDGRAAKPALAQPDEALVGVDANQIRVARDRSRIVSILVIFKLNLLLVVPARARWLACWLCSSSSA
jgi:hypothetical protein